jgi:Trk K+ transport system NAD-binding subunit
MSLIDPVQHSTIASIPAAVQSPLKANPINSSHSRFLVCGLGSLGQFCVSTLNEFGVTVSAITLDQPVSWEVTGLPNMVDMLLFGDCCELELLQQARVQECRAVLLVASDERVNIETAFAVRVLNPDARLIVRSSKENLNELIGDRLGNFVAFEPAQLPAPAFAIAALSSEIRGFISLDDFLLRVVKTPIERGHRWCDRRHLHELNTQTRRVLSHIPPEGELPSQFYQWQPNHRVQAGDQIAYIELTENLTSSVVQSIPAFKPSKQKGAKQRGWQALSQLLGKSKLQRKLNDWWRSTAQQQTKRVALIIGVLVISLWLLGALSLVFIKPGTTFLEALYATGIMLTGESDEVFAVFPSGNNPGDEISPWIRLMNLTYVIAGTAFIGVLYALLTEALLVAKFQLPKKRPPLPEQNHVVLVGLGRVGRRVASFLQYIRQPIVGLSNLPLEPTILPQMPLVVGDLAASLSKVNLEDAKSVVVATDDEMANLEIGLMAHRSNPNCALVIRTFDPRFSASISRLLPYAKVLCAYDLAAEAFVAAAFGENVLNLLRLNEQTVLVTEYFIDPTDSLSGCLLAEVAYGFGVVPILHQRSGANIRLMPSDDTLLEPGDRLVVLATIESLQEVESGTFAPRPCQVCVIEQPLSDNAQFSGANAIHRISNCGMPVAWGVINQLPAVLPVPLYKHQALRLIRELGKCQVMARLVE